jgi:hypothetical protein
MTDLQTFEAAISDYGCAPEPIAMEPIVFEQGQGAFEQEQSGFEQEQSAAAAAGKSQEPTKRSPWRSMGGVFDYEHWADRDRFVELDFLILLSRSEDDEPYRPRRNAHLAAA